MLVLGAMFRVVGVKRSLTINRNSKRKLALEKVAWEEGRGELILSELGARRGVKGGGKPPPWGTEVRKTLQKNGRQDEIRKNLQSEIRYKLQIQVQFKEAS